MYEIFNISGTFIVPCGVYRVRAMAVGGGSGGLTCSGGGGGSGYVRSGEYNVIPGESIFVVVGSGGDGSIGYNSSGSIEYNSSREVIIQTSRWGRTSFFGSFLTANGGNRRWSYDRFGGENGGSGGGQGQICNGSGGGSGGTNGSDGREASYDCFNRTGVMDAEVNEELPFEDISNPIFSLDLLQVVKEVVPVGKGQGTFTTHFSLFTRNHFTPGPGGKFNKNVRGGGGGGGVLLNGSGPIAQEGRGFQFFGGKGGVGYGAGGGAGTGEMVNTTRQLSTITWINGQGGKGANGLVYIEW